MARLRNVATGVNVSVGDSLAARLGVGWKMLGADDGAEAEQAERDAEQTEAEREAAEAADAEKVKAEAEAADAEAEKAAGKPTKAPSKAANK